MKDLYKSGKFVIGFLVMVLVIETSFGEKASEKFCLLTLLSMIIFNAGNFTEFLKGFTSVDSSKKSSESKEKNDKKEEDYPVHNGSGIFKPVTPDLNLKEVFK